MGFELVGKKWSAETFAEYLQSVNLSWANSVTVHHTASPNLAQRPNGLTTTHIGNIESYYKIEKEWDAGPHLFTSDNSILGMSSLWRRGIHAKSFNANSIGIETLGDYDNHDDPLTGRGLACWTMTAKATAIILDKMQLPVSIRTVKFHRDDPKTSKTCPGLRVSKEWFLQLVEANMPAGDTKMTLEQRVERLEQLNGLA